MMSEQPIGSSASVQRQLIDAYLLDLDHALIGLDESERTDVVMSVREHISDSLSERPEPLRTADVETVLSQLGPVERIASAANIHTTVPPATGSSENTRWSKWIPAGLVALALVSLVILIPLPLLALPLALGVTTYAAIGAHAHKGSAERVPYRVATALGSLTLLLGLIGVLTLGLGLAAVTTHSPIPSAPTLVPTPPQVPVPPQTTP